MPDPHAPLREADSLYADLYEADPYAANLRQLGHDEARYAAAWDRWKTRNPDRLPECTTLRLLR
jgi:hypothetical protein